MGYAADKRFSLNSDFQVEKFENEILLYAVSSGNGVYLNETACLVWEMAERGHSQEEMTAMLEEAFPEQKSVIGKDVAAALDALLSQGALLYAEESTAEQG